MKVKSTRYGLLIIKEKTDRVYTESALFYRVKCILNKRGQDLVKKAPATDGNLTDAPYYLRDRKGRYCYYDDQYMLRDIAKDFMVNGQVTLHRS